MESSRFARFTKILLLTLLASAGTMNAQTVTATPSSLTFAYLAGNTLPAAQTVAVKISTGTPTYTVAITGTNTLWLTATPDTGKLPASLGVRVNPTSLAVGQYTASIVMNVSGVSGPITIPVTLTVSAPLPTLTVSASTLAFVAPPSP